MRLNKIGTIAYKTFYWNFIYIYCPKYFFEYNEMMENEIESI